MKHTITRTDVGRVDTAASRIFELSKAKARQLLDNGELFVNNKNVWMGKWTVKVGDVIEIRSKVKPKQISIVLDNNDFIIINKPAGMVVEASYGNESPVLREVKAMFGYDGVLVHRLDKDASGLMIIAKNKATADKFKILFKERKIAKVYEIRVQGSLKNEGLINKKIKREKLGVNKFIVSAKGKEAITPYTIKGYDKIKDETIILCTPVTGRPHQLRVHFAYIKHPLIGDIIYNPKYDGRSLCLKSIRLEFIFEGKNIIATN
jgi:23S rRNA pseudouridine1911/1915/1917 synthase